MENSSSIAACSKLLGPATSPVIFFPRCVSPTGLPDQKRPGARWICQMWVWKSCCSSFELCFSFGVFGRLRLKPTDSMIHLSHWSPRLWTEMGIEIWRFWVRSGFFKHGSSASPLLRSPTWSPKNLVLHIRSDSATSPLSSLERWLWPPRDGPDGRGPR